MNSGVRYNAGEKCKPVSAYAQMGIDRAMVARIDANSADVEYLLKIFTGLQEYCGITTGE